MGIWTERASSTAAMYQDGPGGAVRVQLPLPCSHFFRKTIRNVHASAYDSWQVFTLTSHNSSSMPQVGRGSPGPRLRGQSSSSRTKPKQRVRLLQQRQGVESVGSGKVKAGVLLWQPGSGEGYKTV